MQLLGGDVKIISLTIAVILIQINLKYLNVMIIIVFINLIIILKNAGYYLINK